jgi:hypothetical protein
MNNNNLLPDDLLIKISKFARSNLKSCARDVIEYSVTGILPNGNFKKCANMVPKNLNQIQIAEHIISRVAIHSVAFPE